MRRIVFPLILLLSGCNEIEKEPGHTGSSTPDNVPVDRAAKVAAIMAAEDITVGDVATFVYAYGWTLVPAPLPDATWAASQAGGSPISHYVFELRGAVGDTVLQMYLPNTAGAVALRVRAVDEAGLIGPWSEVGLSRGGVLEGVK